MSGVVICVLLLFASSPPFSADSPRSEIPNQSVGDDNTKLQDTLESILNSDPLLDGADIAVRVDDVSITLTGTVENYGQHQRALQLAEPYTRARKLVDKIRVQSSQTRYTMFEFAASQLDF